MTLVCTATPISATKPSMDDTLKLVPVSHSASNPPTGSVMSTLRKMISGNFRFPYSANRISRISRHGQRQNDLHLFHGCQVVLVLAAPIERVADGKFDALGHLLAGFADGAGEVAPIYGELDADIPGIRFAIDKRRAIFHFDVGELAQRKKLAVRRRDQQVLDGIHILPERLLHTDHQIELALALDHLSGRRATQSRFRSRY